MLDGLLPFLKRAISYRWSRFRFRFGFLDLYCLSVSSWSLLWCDWLSEMYWIALYSCAKSCFICFCRSALLRYHGLNRLTLLINTHHPSAIFRNDHMTYDLRSSHLIIISPIIKFNFSNKLLQLITSSICTHAIGICNVKHM